ncbi:MAG: replicative DNA helicase, partial [Muribaculaceae bacterium]|nr:replicative DNA helicase [Muribaculaceae bacterium]
QLELMKGQLAELEKQRQLEIDKKKTDDSVVEDYNKQIEEMKIAIQDFAVEAANAIYGIDLNGWAQQIGDALVDAFAKGEDAAEAFDKSVADIMRSVVKSIIATEVIAPAMERLRDYLFGDNGVFANYKTGGDFKLSAQDAVGLANELNGVKDEIAAAKDIWDYINDSLGGMLDDTESTKSGLSAGIQSVTEDTADLLASYLNAIRADVAMQTGSYWTRLLDDSLPQMNIIAQSQLDTQRQIAENTLRNAVAAEAIMKSNDDISRLLARVTQGGAKFYVN